MKWHILFIGLLMHITILVLGTPIYLDYKYGLGGSGDVTGFYVMHGYTAGFLSIISYLFMFFFTNLIANTIKCLKLKETIINNITKATMLSITSILISYYSVFFCEASNFFYKWFFGIAFWGNIVFILLEVAKGIIYRFFK